MKNLKDIIASIKKLPPMPEIMGKVLRIADDPTISAKEIIDVIKFDQSITANVLHLCNSSYYGLSRKISSLSEAVVYLGNQTVFNMILSSLCANLLSKRNRGYYIEKGKLWEHSVSCAILAKEIARKVGFNDEQLAYSAGLMHDTGKIILDEYLFDAADKIIKKVGEQKLEFIDIESQIIGFNHAEAGSLLAESWAFPDSMVTAIKYHHRPDDAPEGSDLIYIVHIADALAIMFGFSSGIDGLAYTLSNKAIAALKINEKDIYEFSPFLINQIKKAKDMLEL